MNILGIDTSCDDTSASVTEGGHKVLSNVINSQVRLHHEYGGVVPELASREHIRNIVPVVKQALFIAGLDLKDIDGIAVTTGPGLIGSLLVGLYYAKALAFVNQIPVIDVNHLEGHILSILLEEDAPDFPFVALTVSGGHTSIYHVRDLGDYTLMGQTLDDAAGEAFDKVAKILGLGYPGGPVIEKVARGGISDRVKFPRAFLSRDSFDFSFSGLKTAVSLYIDKWNRSDEMRKDVTREDIAASFQEAVNEVLVHKLLMAREKTGVKSMVIAGGVACNNALRRKFSEQVNQGGFSFHYPRPAYCTDNGAMIALAGYHRIIRGQRIDMYADVRSRYPVKDLVNINQRAKS